MRQFFFYGYPLKMSSSILKELIETRTKKEVLAKLKFNVELRGLSKQAEYYTKVKLFQDLQ